MTAYPKLPSEAVDVLVQAHCAINAQCFGDSESRSERVKAIEKLLPKFGCNANAVAELVSIIISERCSSSGRSGPAIPGAIIMRLGADGKDMNAICVGVVNDASVRGADANGGSHAVDGGRYRPATPDEIRAFFVARHGDLGASDVVSAQILVDYDPEPMF